MQNYDFQSQFSMSKRIRIFLIFFHWRISFVEHIFCYWHFLTTSIVKQLYLLKWHSIFDFYTSDHNFLMAWLFVLGLEEALVECATLCIKSWVKLRNIHNNDGGNWAGDGSKIGKNCQRIVSKNWRHGRRGYQKSRKCQRQLWMVPKTFMCIINKQRHRPL